MLRESVVDTKIDENTGLPRPTIVKKNRNWVKQVLFNSNGYVKPNEMVAILGPSGSGKTSLLNVISQRTGLSQASYAKGDVSINNRKLKSGDYGKMGAYVQQDDVLMSILSPRE